MRGNDARTDDTDMPQVTMEHARSGASGNTPAKRKAPGAPRPKESAKARRKPTVVRPKTHVPCGFALAGLVQRPLTVGESVMIWWATDAQWYHCEVTEVKENGSDTGARQTAPYTLRCVADGSVIDDYPCNCDWEGAVRGEWAWVALAKVS